MKKKLGFVFLVIEIYKKCCKVSLNSKKVYSEKNYSNLL